MKLPERVTEDFIWNDLYSSYSAGTRVFLDWLEKYQKEINWDDLFNANSSEEYSHIMIAPKFSRIPHAMQMGIWLFFLQDQEIYIDLDALSKNGLKEHIRQGVMGIEIDNMP